MYCWILLLGLSISHCGYRPYAGALEPEADQATGMVVHDDGSVVFVKERLEIGLRPMTDQELNRQFNTYSQSGADAETPYTFGRWQEPQTGQTPARFTVFRLRVKNYSYPKVLIDPLELTISSSNGRQYRPLTLLDLDDHFLTYVTGYAGNKHSLYKNRVNILNRTLYKGDLIFSGQEAEGFIVFPPLHMDVRRISLDLKNVALRFDFRSEPVESVDLEFVFKRDVGRFYPATDTIEMIHSSG